MSIKVKQMTEETLIDYYNLEDEIIIKQIITKTLEMKNTDILTVYGLYRNNPEYFSNIRQIIPQRLLRDDNLKLNNEKELNIYLLPKPNEKLLYNNPDEDETENWELLTSDSPKNIRIDMAKGKIKPKKITTYDSFDVYYDLDDTTLEDEEKEIYINTSPFSKLDIREKYKTLSSYIEKELGLKIVEKDLNTYSLNGYYDKDNSMCVINNNQYNTVMKFKTLLSQLSEIIVDKTSTQPQSQLQNEKTLLNAALNILCSYNSKLSDLQIELLNINTLSKTINRVKRASDDIIKRLYISYVKEVENHQAYRRTKAEDITENFMKDI